MTELLDCAVTALEEGRVRDAIPLLEKAVQDEELEAEALVYLGIAYVQDERPALAVEVLERAKEIVEEHCVISLFLGRAHKALGHYDEAIIELKNTVRLDPEHPQAWEDLGNILFLQREYGEAVFVLKDALKTFPHNPALRSIYAICLHRLGDLTTAVQEWQTVLEVLPDSLLAITSTAYLLLILNRAEKARKFVKRAEELAPTDFRTFIIRSELSMQQGDLDLARSALHKVLTEKPMSAPALARLAVIADRAGDCDSCKRYIAEVKHTLVDEPREWWALYYIYSHIGWTDEILQCLRDGTRKDKTSAAPWVLLAEHLTGLGIVDESQDAWKRSFEIRRYVKIHCSSCEADIQLPYDSRYEFDFTEGRTCDSCDSKIPLPEGLTAQ